MILFDLKLILLDPLEPFRAISKVKVKSELYFLDFSEGEGERWIIYTALWVKVKVKGELAF